MKIKKQLSVYVLCLFACTFFFTGCKKDVYNPNKNTPIEDAFDYATTKVIPIAVDYGIKGNKAVFEVYDKNPLETENGVSKKKEGVNSLLTTYTDGNSKRTGKINLPIATSKVYLYSESYGLPTCVEIDVTESGIKFNSEDYIASLKKNQSAKQASKQLAREIDPYNPYNVKTINSWDSDGLPDNLLKITTDESYSAQGILNRIQSTLLPGKNNSQYAKPTEEVNINVLKDTRVTLVFAGEAAQYENTLGYYYYETGKAPKDGKEFMELPKYIAFPKCSLWPPLEYGMRMNLKYYDKDGNATETFPKGTTIGWFIISDGFNYSGGVDFSGKSYWFSNNEFNMMEEKRCVSLYDTETKNIILGFEDGDNRSGVDYDYKDVLFFLTNEDGDIDISDKPTTKPEEFPPVTTVRTGTLAFEDLWPNKGDYDMNDVVITYERSFTVDENNNVTELKDIYTPVHRGGQIKSGFGYQIGILTASVSDVKIENGGSKAENIFNNMESGQTNATFILFDDMEQAVKSGPITVTIKAKGLTSETMQDPHFYNPFIRVSPNKNGKNPIQEVHLTNYPPTDLADLTYFGRYQDHSSLDEDGNLIGPNYYVSDNDYPFAIDLPITDYVVPTEAVHIDEFYPKFKNWASSKGEKNPDWYLHPAKK